MFKRGITIPFSSDKQRKACFATGGFVGKVDCKEWARHKRKKGKKKHMGFLHGSSGLPGKGNPVKRSFKEWVEDNHPEFLESEQ